MEFSIWVWLKIVLDIFGGCFNYLYNEEVLDYDVEDKDNVDYEGFGVLDLYEKNY